jgi:hypothetical protein
MQPEKYFTSSNSVSPFCLPGEVAGCAAAVPCRNTHTVPKGVGKTALFGMLEDGNLGTLILTSGR